MTTFLGNLDADWFVLRAAGVLVAFLACLTPAIAEPPLFVSARLTPIGEYSGAIEGPAVGPSGDLFVMGLKSAGAGGAFAIGRIPAGSIRSELFAKLQDGSRGSGARFGSDGRLYVTDYRKHRILVFEHGQRTPQVYVEGAFLQPNDLAIAADGTLYASDPDFRHTRGQAVGSVWRIVRQPDGRALARRMVVEGERLWRPNGIDLSPDGNTLYVSEADLRQVLAFRIDGDALRDRKVLQVFAAGELDGLRTDGRGRIYVARLTQGKIAMIEPDGTLIREVPTTDREPTNLSFGGPDGRTVYVTQKRGGFIESFRADFPGREFCIGSRDSACGAQ